MLLFGLSIGKKGIKWILVNIFLVLFFASMYFLADIASENSKYIQENFGKTNKKHLIDYIYFSLSTQTTVGLDSSSTFVDPNNKSNKLTTSINIIQLLSVLMVVAMSV